MSQILIEKRGSGYTASYVTEMELNLQMSRIVTEENISEEELIAHLTGERVPEEAQLEAVQSLHSEMISKYAGEYPRTITNPNVPSSTRNAIHPRYVPRD